MDAENDTTGSDAAAHGSTPPGPGSRAPGAEAPGAGLLSLHHSQRPRTGTVMLVLVLGMLGLGMLFAIGFRPHFLREQALAGEADHIRTAPQQVAVVHAQPGAAKKELLLPGDCVADQASDLFARTNGYLRSWKVDIGDVVHAGATICTIETPEVDEELHQAEATLVQSKARVLTAKANNALTAITLKRYSELRDQKVISEQEYSERLAADEVSRAELEAAQADVLVSEANQRRLAELRTFETMVAPFDGVISARNTEVGSLVTSGSAPGAKPLFRINRIDLLRIYVDVPQTNAFEVKVGQTVHIIVREHPDQLIEGLVTRTAGVIDSTTRTLRIEVQVKNPTGQLFAGMYVQVQVSVPIASPPLLVPGSTLIFNSEGNRLALVRDSHVHFQPVLVAGDYGRQIGISGGISQSDLIIANPSAQLVEGAAVEPMEIAPAGR